MIAHLAVRALPGTILPVRIYFRCIKSSPDRGTIALGSWSGSGAEVGMGGLISGVSMV